jgi:hypothetical protein
MPRKNVRKLRCPTPRKTRFETLEDAERTLRVDFQSTKVPIRAYQCQAGHWHLSSQIAWRR